MERGVVVEERVFLVGQVHATNGNHRVLLLSLCCVINTNTNTRARVEKVSI